MNRKPQGNKFVSFQDVFRVTVPHTDPSEDRFEWTPTGLNITNDRFQIYIDYAGDRAGDCQLKLKLPYEPTFLRALAKALEAFADEQEGKKK